MPGQTPLPLAMIICDQVVRDRTTGKMTIMGTFANITAPSFPATHPQLSVFIELTDGRGDTDLTLKLVRMVPEIPQGEILSAHNIRLDCSDPLTVLTLDISVQNVQFPAAGEYRFVLESDGILVIERRVIVQELPHA